MKLFALLFVAGLAFGQPATQKVYTMSGGNLIAVCEAMSTVTNGARAATSVAISGVTKAAAAVVTSAGHGFAISSRPTVTITGATGTGWTGINAAWTATVIDVDTFSIPIDSTGFGVLAGTVVFKTTAPRSTMPEWSVMRLAYDVGNNLIWSGYLNGTAAMNQKCSEGSSTTLNQQ